MQFFALATALFSLAATPQLIAASPFQRSNAVQGYGGGFGAQESLCNPGLFSSAQCCSTGVADAVYLDCAPPRLGTTLDKWQLECAKVGKRPACCFIPLLGLGVLCNGANV
ncbi:fungal hydrophobin-domain-containing protein [Mycena sanguinolenta]|nr:fungal hydrophobin-domain-containing protein [Mycena sanguinolenta]